MRILSVALYLHRTMGPEFPNKPEAYPIIHNVSALTHAHPISLIACDIYCSVANKQTEYAKFVDETFSEDRKGMY